MTASADIVRRVWETPAVHQLVEDAGHGGALTGGGACAGAQSFLCASLSLQLQRTLVLVATGRRSQEIIQQDLETWLACLAPGSSHQEAAEGVVAGHIRGSNATWFYPAWESLPHEGKLPHADVISDRLMTVMRLLEPSQVKNAPPLVVTSVAALMQRTFAPAALRARMRLLRKGDRLDPTELMTWLEEQGYEPEAKVTQFGEVSLRGGILDVYPVTQTTPIRIEFFGDEVDSLRHFDPQTQVSTQVIESVLLPPGGELGILRREVGGDSVKTDGLLATLLDYLPSDTLFVMCEPDLLIEQASLYSSQVPENDPFFISWEELGNELSRRGMTRLDLSELTMTPSDLGLNSLELYRPMGDRPPEPQIAETQRREFFTQMHRWTRQGYTVKVFCNNAGERERFKEIWQEYGLTEIEPNPGPAPLRPEMSIGSLSRGFVCDAARLAVVTDAEIFGRYRVQAPRRLKSAQTRAMRSALEIDFSELEEGDYVVHLQHGIGRYCGLERMPDSRRPGGEAPQGPECLVIEYAPSAPDQSPPRLYVPVTEAHLVSKYVGAGKARPPLSTLGGTRWAKAKAQAEHAVRDLAGEMLQIQASRAAQAGHAYRGDTPWQREFESSFLYEETLGQRHAISETKRDMETPRPMDRLICGDVGFGKTEVALRAAFKAVMDGKQVAVLVPTTVLAQQHYNTFRERMADYPVRIELLSRFRSRREQKRVIQDLARGAVDIVVGTHRLVQDDITFKDLGLVVIDEEQRFGVLHKEKFKHLRHLVDVLTLSATPIPRTLYLALMGARDMSTIETPPQDRLPVETYVIPYDERVIRDAIQRELNRQGQVFFLHNRVSTISVVEQKLRALVPQARMVVGHGQMDSDELEEVMTTFINGQADVLLSTTIIESGLDIPNANTIIIDRADRFGLSDLYQLRGRVGRYKHQAYAYFLLPRHAGLLSDARKRLSAIKQYSSLGSGFRIAMRDLEIRGAGNLLGSEQSGHITAVGFELYCQLLKQSVSALKGEPVKRRVEVRLRIDFITSAPGEKEEAEDLWARPRRTRDAIEVPREVASYVSQGAAPSEPRPTPKAAAYLPVDYVPDDRQRIEIYRKLAQVSDTESLSGLKNECRDRFGPLPEPVELLLLLYELKVLAAERSITEIETREDRIMLKRNEDYLTACGKFPRMTKRQPASRLKEIKRLLLAMSVDRPS